MAVTKIRKISSTTLLVLSAISVITFLLFFLGGSELDAKGNKVYEFTGILLSWSYVLLVATICATILFALRNLASAFKSNSRNALMSLGALVAFVILLVVTYAIGDGTPIPGLNDASQGFNTSGWLKMTDMWLYSTYVLFILAVVAVIWGGISKRFTGK